MKTVATAVLFVLCVMAPWAWAGSVVTVIDEVRVDAVVDSSEFLLEDGRRLFLKRPVAEPDALIGRMLRVIATVDPRAAEPALTAADLLTPLVGLVLDLGKSSDEIDVLGTVTKVDVSSFDLVTEAGEFQVVVDDSTAYHDLDGLEDLSVGDAAGVKGQLDGSMIAAEEIRASQSDGGDDDGDDGGGDDDDGDDGDGDDGDDDDGCDAGGCDGDDDGSGDDDDDDDDGDDDDGDHTGVVFKSLGQIVDLLEGARFLLGDLRIYDTGNDTLYSDGLTGYGDLRLGMLVEIKAVRDPSGVNWALEIKLESEEDGVAKIHGEIQSVDLTGFVLIDGPRIEVSASTDFDGDADRLADLLPGWRVEAKTYEALGILRALEVKADDPGVAPVDGEEFVPHQALVVLAAGADPPQVADRYDAVVLGDIGDVAVLFWWEDEIDEELLALMGLDPEIAAVEPNYLFRDPESVRRRYVVVDRQHTDEEYLNQMATIVTRLRSAQVVADGKGSVVAVMDTGIDPEHPAVVGRILDGGLDLVDGDSEPWESRDGEDQDGDGDIDESAGHGTFVSSLVLLVAPGSKILPYRVLDDDGGGSAYQLSLALADAIVRRVDVISLSLVYHRRSAAVDLLLEKAGAEGIAVVAAAGNDGLDVLSFPASDRHTVAVTGLKVDGSGLVSYANRSPEVSLAAPSEEIYGAVDGDRWGTWSGSSMAVPFVAGAMALLRQVDPGIDPEVFAELLSQTGTPLTDNGWTGFGLNLGAAMRQMVPMVEHRMAPAEPR